MNIELYPKGVFWGLLLIIFVLLFLNVMGIVSSIYLHGEIIDGFIKLFNFDRERNVPSIYSAATLLLSAFLLFVISMAHREKCSPYFYWVGLAAVFFFLSVDEMFSVHERFSHSIRYSFNMTGLFYYSWVVPYGIGSAFLLLLYIRFLIKLPRSTMVLFVVSGSVFVSGAMGFEMITGGYAELHGKANLVYPLLYTCEEFFEMLGIAMFIYALLMYIVGEFKMLTININNPKAESVDELLHSGSKSMPVPTDSAGKS